MSTLLRKLKLVDDLIIELEISRHEFTTRLSENVKEGAVSSFFDVFDLFSFSKQEFKGRVEADRFKIKKRVKLFDSLSSLAVARGTFYQKDNMLVIQTEINGFSSIMVPGFVFITLVYAFAFIALIFSQDAVPLWAIPFLIFHAALMYGIPYFMMRKSKNRLKYDLEREFHFLTKK